MTVDEFRTAFFKRFNLSERKPSMPSRTTQQVARQLQHKIAAHERPGPGMSFWLTKRQFLDGLKDVTRRLGWLKLKAGDIVTACEKCMGLKRGEKRNVLGRIKIVSVRREPLAAISADDCRREGFPQFVPSQFVGMFCQHHKGCTPKTLVTRIEFVRLPKASPVAAAP